MLAGFLRKIPGKIVELYRNRMINLHPALLPRYGGKGMYGENVFKAIEESGEVVTGITIHWVDEEYDTGSPVLLAPVSTAFICGKEQLAQRIHQIEHFYLPRLLLMLLKSTRPECPLQDGS